MKKTLLTRKIKRMFFIVLLIAGSGLFTQCKKDLENLIVPKTTSTVTVYNPTYTTIDIVFNGESRSIAPGGSSVFTDDEGTYATGSASTSGKTTSGAQVGLLMTWNSIGITFPTAGTNYDYTLNISGTYFFLKMQNLSTKTISKVYVNYGLVSQTVDNISIPNNGTTYSLGYYLAYTNSNVRAESGATYWYWNPLSLSFTNNQSTTLVAN